MLLSYISLDNPFSEIRGKLYVNDYSTQEKFYEKRFEFNQSIWKLEYLNVDTSIHHIEIFANNIYDSSSSLKIVHLGKNIGK